MDLHKYPQKGDGLDKGYAKRRPLTCINRNRNRHYLHVCTSEPVCYNELKRSGKINIYIYIYIKIIIYININIYYYLP
nr:MAG TPA: hypothetical protein [Caudoviricetes sp.]